MSAMAMTVFIVIETEDIEIVSATPYMDRALADEAFETLAGEYMLQEYETGELEREAPGTIRLAGDDSYAVQMFEREVTGL